MFQHFVSDDQTKPNPPRISKYFLSSIQSHCCILALCLGSPSYDSWYICFLQHLIFNRTYNIIKSTIFGFICEMRSLALILIEIIIGLAAFRFETQSKVWRSSLIFPWQKLHPKTEFISLLDFWKDRFGKICIFLDSFTLSPLIDLVPLAPNWGEKIQIQNVFSNKNVFPITDVLDCGDLSVHFSYETCN